MIDFPLDLRPYRFYPIFASYLSSCDRRSAQTFRREPHINASAEVSGSPPQTPSAKPTVRRRFASMISLEFRRWIAYRPLLRYGPWPSILWDTNARCTAVAGPAKGIMCFMQTDTVESGSCWRQLYEFLSKCNNQLYNLNKKSKKLRRLQVVPNVPA